MMNPIKFLFVICALVCAGEAHAACSKQNLSRCLDSACAINIGMNPAARCQLCGSSGAGSAPAGSGMTQLSLGASSKNTISDKELKAAPKDPSERYPWAITECLKKISGCAPEDAEDYDKLVEQSCRAAGIEMQASAAAKKLTEKKSGSACESEINLCVRDDKNCGPGFESCRADSDFDRVFSECSVAAVGCADFNAGIRGTLFAARDSAVKNAGTLIANIVARYKADREKKIADARSGCDGGAARDDCIASVCSSNMKNNCGAAFPGEKSMATLLCKFHDTACSRLK
jgi:hypothetical protein